MKGYKTWGKSRSLRLPHLDYKCGGRAYHVIIGTLDGRKLFCSDDLNELVVECVKKAAEIYGYTLVVYCLMPDHLHIMVQGKPGCRDLKACIGGFKSYTNRVAGTKLWQRGFYDHVLRKDEVLLTVAEYILNNPVRRGLVKRREEYRWGEVVM